MLTALDPQATTDYTCAGDAGEPTVFQLRGLDGRGKIRVMSQARIEGKGIVYSPEAIDEALRLGLHGWRNLHDRQGREVAFSGDPVRDLAHLDINTIMELFGEIMDRSGLGQKLKKKSSSPSP